MLLNLTCTRTFIFLSIILPIFSLVYKAPDVFYSQLCILSYTGDWNVNVGQTCTTEAAQTGVVRVGIAMAYTSKNVGQYHDFSASVNAPTTDPVSSFTIVVSTILPSGSSMRTAFFLVVIKSQPVDKMIDLAEFSFITDPLIDNNNSGGRSTSTSIDITTLPSAIFTTGANVLTIPFVTSFSMFPPLVSGALDGTSVIEYIITASISGNSLTVILNVNSFTKISALKGIVILFNPITINTVRTAKSWNISLVNRVISTGGILNLTTNSAQFGPNFNSKCIFGFNRLQYQGDFSMDYYFTNTSLAHYQSYHFDSSSSPQADGSFLCFGNNTQCGEPDTYLDLLDQQCYQATTCPLPVYTGWASTRQCPKCAQLICLTCTAANRSNCLSCGPNSTPTSGICACNAGFWPFTTAISTSAQGQWNNQANSLTECRQNCTNLIPGCQWDKCTLPSCTACLTGYMLKTDASGNKICQSCSSLSLTNCVDCVVFLGMDVCKTCDPGYYAWGQCKPCPSGCATCSQVFFSGLSCSSCLPGYIYDSNTKKCNFDCSNLSNCLTCSSPTVCTSCVAGYYLNTFDNLCYPCNLIHSACLTCTAWNMCSTCNTNYITLSTPSGDTCVTCGSVLNNCTSCSSTTVCTNCDQFFGLNATSKCQNCQILITGCLDCENQLSCITCMTGYYLGIDPLTLSQVCYLCTTLIPNCQTCTPIQCFSCISPYLLAPDGTCTNCVFGYEFRNNVCTNLTGCQSSVKLSNGTEICIACDQALHFYFNSTFMKCVCIQGFKEFYRVGLLPICLPVCGDGIIISEFQNCDDKNMISGDGCDSTCQKEAGFDCGTVQPSQCILHLNFNIIVFNYASRVIGQNTGILSFTILPAHPGLQKMAWSKLVKFNFSSTSVDPSQLKFSYSSSTAQLLVTVPYMQELQNGELTTSITLDPKYIVSATSNFVLQNKLNGVNAPLMFQPETMLSTQKSINTISLVMMILLLLQFYVGSYFHKMIGLETIQVIQSIYFVRMVATSKQTSLLNSMNLVQYSASGYQNSELLFGSSAQQIQQNSSDSIDPQFLSIGMYKNFLMNVNISLFPLILIGIAYVVSLARKYRKRNEFIETQQQSCKDQYTNLRRSSQWVYDHLVFPFVMMFNSISFFNVILELSYSKNPQSPSQPTSIIQYQSSIALNSILFATIAIYCYEVFSSYREYSRFSMTQRQRDRIPLSLIQKLQHDQNNTDRANYHPLYVFVYLLYYLLLSLVNVLEVLVSGFRYCLEMVMGLGICYFVIICCWKPYHQSINVHNHFLKLYYGTFVLFTIICYLFSKVNRLSTGLYVSLMYIVMGLLACILMGGFLRIFFESKYRKQLIQNSEILEWKKYDQQLNQKLKQYEKDPSQLNNKKKNLLAKNQYAFKNQLKEIKKKFASNTPLMIPGIQEKDPDLIHPQEEDKIVQKIRYDIQKRRQSIDIENWKEEMRRKHSNDSDVDLGKLLNESVNKDSSLISFSNQAQSPNQSPIKSQEKANKNKTDTELLREIKLKLRSEHAVS